VGRSDGIGEPMNEDAPKVSDPARDLIAGITLISQQRGSSAVEKISSACKVSAWSKDFFRSVKILCDLAESIHSFLLDDPSLDSQDIQSLSDDINRILNLFDGGMLNNNWGNCQQPGAPVGPETMTFLRSASRQLRSKHSYGTLSESDQNLISNTIELIRSDMGSVQLEKADFAREALLRGCDEVSFILSRIEVFGFSRIEAPIMELGAFLFTIGEELNRVDGSNAKIKKSMASLSRVYSRMYELSKIASMAKMGYDGASWLITHLNS
jgi:hypothetical protein